MQIPRQHQQAVQDFCALPDETASTLVSALRETPPSLHPSEFSSSVEGRVHLGIQKTQGIVSLLRGLYLLREHEGKALDAFLDEVLAAFKELHDRLKPPKQIPNLPRLHPLLTQLLSLDQPLGVSAKALEVSREHERFFCEARILTDLRPVFRPGAADSIVATVITHTLRIHFHQGGEIQEFFVAMDPEDVRELASLCTRAISKEEAIRRSFTKEGIPYLISPKGVTT